MDLDHLDLICEALDGDISEIIVREPNSEIRIKTRTGAPIHSRTKR